MTDKELEAFYDRITGRIDEVNSMYLRSVAEQIKKIGGLSASRVNMLVQMREAGASVRKLRAALMRATGLNDADLQRVFDKAAADAYTDARFMYIAKGVEPLPFSENAPLQMAIAAIARQTVGAMENYSNTTNIDGAYREAVSKAVQAVQSGVTDYNSAMRQTVRETAERGLQVEYESGAHRRLDTAARQNVINAVRQVNQQAAIIMGEQIGADGYELSAHPQSAPDHEPVQGRVFDIANYEHMQLGEVFEDVDGRSYKGFPRPIAEWNCRHFASPFLLGVSKRRYTQQQLDEMQAKNKEGCTIGGKHYTTYEAAQKMREIETAIRREKDRANMAKITGDDVLRRECQSKITNLTAQYNIVARASGLRKQYERTYVDGFRAVKRLDGYEAYNKKAVDSSGRSGIMKLQLFAGKPDYTKQPPKSLHKSMLSLSQRMEEHQQRIRDPYAYVDKWDELDSRHQAGLLAHWGKEVKNFDKQIAEIQEELKKRGK